MASKPLLQLGLRKNIRSGFNTKVWSDPWIPLIPARPANDAGLYRDPNLYVNHLIDFDSKKWKLDLIHQIIEPRYIPLILGLKPSRVFEVDDYCWSYSKSGQYTVKSGYQVARNQLEENGSQEILEPSLTKIKSQVWKQKTSRKVKHFMWQVVAGCVSTCSRLVDRHCGTDRSCPRCGSEEESINHLLFECPPALQVWALSPILTIPGSFPSSSVYSNFDYLLWRAKKSGVAEDHLQIFPWMLWYIWKARNEKVFKGKDITSLETLQLATSETKSWKMANLVEEHCEAPLSLSRTINSERSSQGEGWRCQIDASWKNEDQFSGCGFIVSQDNVVRLIGLKCTDRLLSPLHAELEALFWALESIVPQGLGPLIFESDCAEMLKLIEGLEEWPAFINELEVFNSFKEKFSDVSFSFIPRRNNICADIFARARDCLFFHVSPQVPSWLSHEICLFEPA